MHTECSFVQDWSVFEDNEPSLNDSSSFGLDYVVVATPVITSSPRRRPRRASLTARLSQALDLSESSFGASSVQSEQLKTATQTKATRRQRPGSCARPIGHTAPRTPVTTRRRRSISHTTDKQLNTTDKQLNNRSMTSCSLIDLMKVGQCNLDTASSSSGSTPSPQEQSKPRRPEEHAHHSSPRRSSPRRTRRLLTMPQVGTAKQLLQQTTTENACTRRMARRMSQTQ